MFNYATTTTRQRTYNRASQWPKKIRWTGCQKEYTVDIIQKPTILWPVIHNTYGHIVTAVLSRAQLWKYVQYSYLLTPRNFNIQTGVVHNILYSVLVPDPNFLQNRVKILLRIWIQHKFLLKETTEIIRKTICLQILWSGTFSESGQKSPDAMR